MARGQRPIAEEELLEPDQLALEELLLSMRTVDGVQLGSFRRRHGIDLVAANRARVETAIGQGLLRLDGDRLRPTAAGLAVADGIARTFALSAGHAA